MATLVYSPSIINSYISYIYTSREELDINSENCIFNYVPFYLYDEGQTDKNIDIQIIPDIDINHICVVMFDTNMNMWKIYHGEIKLQIEDINFSLCLANFSVNLAKDSIYLAVLYKNSVYCIQSINKNGKIDNFWFPESYYYDAKNSSIYQKQYLSDHSNKYIVSNQRLFSKFNNIIALGKEKGLIYLNPANSIDLIFCLISAPTTNYIEEISTILASKIYKESTFHAFEDFIDKILLMKSINPKPGYGIVHKYFHKNDKIYFENKIKTFQKNVMDILEHIKCISYSDLAPFIAKFVSNLKQDICLELSIVYHRFRHFPKEREIIYHKYGNNSYVKILKYIHQKYLEKYKCTGAFIDPTIISDILFSPSIDKTTGRKSDPYIIYNERTSLLVDALQHRSELFGSEYELFLNSQKNNIKPKYKTKYNYYPFKIFSPNLFIMEHLLMISDQ